MDYVEHVLSLDLYQMKNTELRLSGIQNASKDVLLNNIRIALTAKINKEIRDVPKERYLILDTETTVGKTHRLLQLGYHMMDQNSFR